MQRIEREPCFYHDESGERFRELVLIAERERAKKINGVKQVIFWMAVIFVVVGIVCRFVLRGGTVIEAVGYLRCSGDSFQGETWDRQQEAITRYANSHDIHIAEWFRDEWVPGKTELKHRPGLAACMARVEANCIKLVLVEGADRLARDSMVSELIIREFQKYGVRVISASGGVDLTAGDDTNPTAKLIRQVLAAVAEFDRCVTVLKLRAARQRLRDQNGKCEGRKAYGTKTGEDVILDIIMDMKRKDYSADGIALMLNDLKYKTRYGKPWHGATVRKILSRNSHFHETCGTIAPDSVQTKDSQS